MSEPIDLSAYLFQMEEIEKLMPSKAEFLRLSQESPPPQEWFDDDFDPGRIPVPVRRSDGFQEGVES